MLTDEQKLQVQRLAADIAPLKTGFPKWNPELSAGTFFPDNKDLKAMAEKVQPFSFNKPDGPLFSSPKNILKTIFFYVFQPAMKKLFTKQMLFNEYVWLLANTVAFQNQKIQDLEKQLNDINKKHLR